MDETPVVIAAGRHHVPEAGIPNSDVAPTNLKPDYGSPAASS
jgi:hypothetical protein